MLTQEQLSQLKPLTKHPKFGKLLKSAIKCWNKFKPQQNMLGVHPSKGLWRKYKNSEGCCLIGASIWNSKYKPSNPIRPFQKFKISINDQVNLVNGFDNLKGNEKSHGYRFAEKVRKIVIV